MYKKQKWIQRNGCNYEQNPTTTMKSLKTKTKTQIKDLLHEVQLQMPEARARKGHKGPKAMGPREQLIELTCR